MHTPHDAPTRPTHPYQLFVPPSLSVKSNTGAPNVHACRLPWQRRPPSHARFSSA
jgi:hypothetical protein